MTVEKVTLAELKDDDLVGSDDACRILGGERSPISRATLDRGIAASRFPSPMKIGATNRWRVGWLRDCLREAETKRSQPGEAA
ncbi:helix-turn-helix transcriptional regulator [Mesorhizobium loti]|uniref:helix-turn-helix transcriptional regulator n=1 Tax=Rhizobium loti TaxID=381 RepID=UPI0012BC1636|nr:hypothetical protein [Mesorhizobium loti]